MDKMQKLDVRKPETASPDVTNFQELTPLLQAAVYATVSDISDQLTITASPKVQISPRFQAHRELFPKQFDDDLEQRRHALTYLKQVGAIQSFDSLSLHMLLSEPWQKVEVQVREARFRQIKDVVTEAFNHQAKAEAAAPVTKRSQEKPAAQPPRGQGTEVMYEVRFTPAREILINNFLLTRLDFDSENDNVFKYLYEHPNQTISLDDLEERLGGTRLKKSLHKIVENLGFVPEIRKAFFDTSKDSIRFRNPVTRTILEELKIDWFRFPRR